MALPTTKCSAPQQHLQPNKTPVFVKGAQVHWLRQRDRKWLEATVTNDNNARLNEYEIIVTGTDEHKHTVTERLRSATAAPAYTRYTGVGTIGTNWTPPNASDHYVYATSGTLPTTTFCERPALHATAHQQHQLHGQAT